MKIKVLTIILVLFSLKNFAQIINLNKDWKFHTGDDRNWAKLNFSDSTWTPILPMISYEKQGFEGYKGYSWYRIKFFLPEEVRTKSPLKKDIRLDLSKINGTDEVFLNGVKIAQTMIFSTDARKYFLVADSSIIHWNQENVIAVRIYGKGGMYEGDCGFDMASPIDYIKMNTADNWDMSKTDSITKKIYLTNTFDKDFRGSIQTTYFDSIGKRQGSATGLKLKANETLTFLAKMPRKEDAKIEISFTEMKTFKQIIVTEMTPKIQVLLPIQIPK